MYIHTQCLYKYKRGLVLIHGKAVRHYDVEISVTVHVRQTIRQSSGEHYHIVAISITISPNSIHLPFPFRFFLGFPSPFLLCIILFSTKNSIRKMHKILPPGQDFFDEILCILRIDIHTKM